MAEIVHDVTINQREYCIVGDDLAIPTLYSDAPPWLKDLVDVVVEVSTETNNTDLLNQIQSLIDALANATVPLNTFTQSILSLVTEDTRLNAVIETLNSNLTTAVSTTNAQIIDIRQTYVSKDEASATVANVITAQLENGVLDNVATIGHVSTVLANETEARALDYTSLESTIAGEAELNATAVQYLNTYVGIEEDGTPTGVGLLADTEDLQLQVDSKIEYWFQSTNPNTWSVADRTKHNKDVWYNTSTKLSYYYASSANSWNAITDAKALEAIAVASTAQATADGKVTTFYQNSAPIAESIGDLWIDSNDGNKMYRWNGSSWVDSADTRVVANAEAVTELEVKLNNGNGTWLDADNVVTQSLESSIEDGDANVESKWEYNSVVGINGVYKKSGFGLTSNYTSGSGTESNPYTSEFWIDASRFKFTNSNQTGSISPFTIDDTGTAPQITFNGVVDFTSTNSEGTTTIDGSKITTGSISANHISTAGLDASQITAGVLYNTGGSPSNYTMKVDLDNGTIHIK